MNVDNFAEYLAQPAKLYQLPYQEIKNLVAEYPYSANLRLLMALKSKLENDPKFDQYVHQLAAHTMDRAHLQRLLEEELLAITDLATEAEERLELKALEELQDNLVKLPAQEKQEEQVPLASTASPAIVFTTEPAPREDEEPLVDIDWPVSAPEGDTASSVEEEKPGADQEVEEKIADQSEEPMVDDSPIHESKVEDSEETSQAFQLDGNLLKDLAAMDKTLKLIFKGKPKKKRPAAHQYPPPVQFRPGAAPAPLPHSSFSNWQPQPPEDKRDRFRKLRQKHHEHPPSPKMTARKIAKQSIKEAPGLVSETLARLLAEQGQHGKAIKMYKQLSLLFPEKSRYFAGIIKNLKQNS